MAWKYPITSTSNLYTVDLGDTDSVFVAKQVAITGYDGGIGIYGTGSNHQAYIAGTVAADLAIALGDDPTVDKSEKVTVSTDGTVFSGDTAINISAYSSTVINHGIVQSAHTGIFVDAESATGSSSITNTGTIAAITFGVNTSQSTQAISFLNTGIVTSDNIAFDGGDAVETVVNKGTMVGDIYLIVGNDTYNGLNGKLTGTVYGGDGNDKLYGGKENNVFDGGDGTDTLYGVLGADTLTGGADGDVFLFKSSLESTVAASGRDTITDFHVVEGDTIDLHSIDASTKKVGNQAFDFIGTQAFHHVADELRYQKISGDTYVYGDVNGDAKADFSIKLSGLVNLTASDFLL